MVQRLSIKHLQVLAAYRRTGSLTKIAEFLKLTPSAVSRRIDEAEAKLGLVLFARAGNRVRLTPAGEYILQAAERILADLDRAESVASRLSSDVHHIVRIGMAIYRSFAWLPDFEAYLRKAAPGVGLELVASLDGDEFDALKGHIVDIVLTPLLDDLPGASRVRLFGDEIVALVAPGHRLAKRRAILPADVEPEDFYTYSLSVTPGFEYIKFLQPGHARPRRYVLVATPESAAAAARGGQGLTILSRWAMRSDIEDRRLVALPLSERGVKIEWAALLRVADGKASVAQDVARHLQAFFAQREGASQRRPTRRRLARG